MGFDNLKSKTSNISWKIRKQRRKNKKIYLDYKIINKIVNQIVNVANPQKVILFGSYVDGNLNEDSDIDILVVKSNIKSKIDEYTKIRKSLRGINSHLMLLLLHKNTNSILKIGKMV